MKLLVYGSSLHDVLDAYREDPFSSGIDSESEEVDRGSHARVGGTRACCFSRPPFSVHVDKSQPLLLYFQLFSTTWLNIYRTPIARYI